MALLGVVVPLHAEPFDLTNDLGDIGLLQTPTARFADDGEFGVGYSIVKPYNQIHFLAEVLPWLQTSFRYTRVTDAPYGGASTTPQSYKDRSFGFKLRLQDEGAYLPAIALGVTDFGGTGVFDSEYLVADRRIYDFDFSLGLGWGRVGAGGHIPNPLGKLSSHFDNPRVTTDGTTPGGSGVSRLFIGKTVGLFGGAQWRTPIPGVSLVVEYDGNDYQHENVSHNLTQASRVNVGVDYEAFPGIHVGAGYERGNLATLNVEIRTNFVKFGGIPKFADPPPLPIVVRKAPATPQSPLGPSEEMAAVDKLKTALAAVEFNLETVRFNPDEADVEVWIRQDRFISPAKVIGRTARILSETAPAQIERFTVINLDAGIETYRVTVLRRDFEHIVDGTISTEEILVDSQIVAPKPDSARAGLPALEHYPQLGYDMGPGLRQQIGGPNGFYFGEILWTLGGNISVTPHLLLSGSAGIDLVDNFSGLTLPSNSELPHVRSDIAKYLKQGRNPLSQLEADYLWSPWQSWFARVSAGIFEDMYGGVASQILFRPFGSRFAVGVDANYLKQRSFNERFDFKDYWVATGFLDLYYNLPVYDLTARVSYGRYLARDHGATFDISRRFADGVQIGAFVTLTDVSAAQFGEGSFDKGIYLSMPFDLFFAKSSREVGTYVYRPLTRDGGARAVDGIDLYGATQADNLGQILQSWSDVEH